MTTPAEQENRISELAQSLKRMHLAASIEEAYTRAREILDAPKSAEDRSVREMARDIESLRTELRDTSDTLKADEQGHAAEVQEGASSSASVREAQASLLAAKKKVEKLDAELAELESDLDKTMKEPT